MEEQKKSNGPKVVIGVLLLVVAILAYMLTSTKGEVTNVTEEKERLHVLRKERNNLVHPNNKKIKWYYLTDKAVDVYPVIIEMVKWSDKKLNKEFGPITNQWIKDNSMGSTDFVDILDFGKSIRYSDAYKKDGVNVNIVQEIDSNSIHVQTYERGVEDETLSCGTGVTACALVWMDLNPSPSLKSVDVTTKGGDLVVEAIRNGEGFSSIWLSGPAKLVFDGRIDV